MNILSGITELAGIVSSDSSFSDLHCSGSLLLTAGGQEKEILLLSQSAHQDSISLRKPT